MSDAIVMSPSSYKRMAWLNGHGYTTELLSQRALDMTGFDWRISIADVVTDGAFSDFNGCDRILLILEGNGVMLRHDSGIEDNLRNGYALARFPGDQATHAYLHDGPIRDFNVIFRRGLYSAYVDVLEGGGRNELVVNSDLFLVYAIGDGVRARSKNMQERCIDKGHLLKCSVSVRGRWILQGGPLVAVQLSKIGLRSKKAQVGD
ncbi:MAG TPA: HutD family protein [Woeseiaceae bacterium]|nr:HutD family protein [Woeseiaceae bacterium]